MEQKNLISIDTFRVITQAIAEIEDIETMASYMCNLIASSLEIKGCSIYVLNEENNELELLASYGLSSDYLVKGPVDPKKSLECLKTQQPIVIKDTQTDPRVQYPKQAEQEGIKSIIGVPIIFQGKAIGTFRLYTEQTCDINEEDLESLLILCELIGMALKYANLYTTLHTIKELIEGV